MKEKKKLIFLVAIISLFIHGIGLYLLCHLSLGANWQFAKNPFSLSLVDKFIEKSEVAKTEEVDVDSSDSAIAEPPSSLTPKGNPLSLLNEKSPTLKAKPFPTPTRQLMEKESESVEIPDVDEKTDEKGILGTLASFFSESELPPLNDEKAEGNWEEILCDGDHFTASLEYAPRSLRSGYVFKVTLTPKQEIPFKKMKQNLFFLVDRSNSIPRARYLLNKKAIASSLSLLSKEDHFNILIFDDHIVRFSPDPQICNEENVNKAKEFLESQGHGGHFTTTNITASLGKILPDLVKDNEVNCAILLSDGDSNLSVDAQRLLIHNWSKANSGKVSLHCFASGSGNNFNLLEMIAAFNKGTFLYVTDPRQIEEKLKQLVLSLHHPLGKEITATALTLEKDNNIILQPKNGRLSDLYKNRSFTLYGVINKPADFTLFVQGKFYDRKFDLKKKISFTNGRVGSLDLERKYVSLLVQDYFEQYFKDGKVAHLEAADRLLSPLNLKAPFIH